MAKRNENDATTTKSGIKRGANIVEQLDNEKKLDNLENSKGYFFSQLSDYFLGFDLVKATDEVIKNNHLTAEQLQIEAIQKFVNAQVDELRKKAIEIQNTTTAEAFRAKFKNFSRFYDFFEICGYTFERALNAVITNDGVKIYHSISEGEIKDGSKKQAYEVETVKKTTILGAVIEKTVWVEFVELNTTNLIKALRYYAVLDSAIVSVNHQAKKDDKPFYNLQTALFNCAKAVGVEEMKAFIIAKIEELS